MGLSCLFPLDSRFASPNVTREPRARRSDETDIDEPTKPTSPDRRNRHRDMSKIVTLRADPHAPRLVYLCTRPELSSVMGGFGPARFIGHSPPVPGASYVVELDDLDRFRVYCTNRGVSVVDTREDMTRRRPPWAERALPECRECGQPRARYAQPVRCPQCDEPWVDG